MAASGKNRAAASPEDIIKYQDAWAEMMVTIWREKIEKLRVYDTRRLYHDIEHETFHTSDSAATLKHRFMEYGIYQDCGVGNGYKRLNEGGDLYFLDPEYRAKHHLGKPRKPREWFSRAYFASVKVLRDEMAYIYAENFAGLLVDAISKTDNHRSTSMRSHLWGHHAKTRGSH